MSDTTFIEKARAAYPDTSDDELEHLVWNVTSFPFGTTQQVLLQLSLSYATSGGDIQHAITDAHDEIETAMEEYRMSHSADKQMQVV